MRLDYHGSGVLGLTVLSVDTLGGGKSFWPKQRKRDGFEKHLCITKVLSLHAMLMYRR